MDVRLAARLYIGSRGCGQHECLCVCVCALATHFSLKHIERHVNILAHSVIHTL